MNRPILLLVLIAALGFGLPFATLATDPAAVAGELPARHELPWNLRRELPELDLTVFYWNEDPDQRFVKINGEKYVESDQPAPEVWLREIRPDSLVFEFRGQRFQIRAY
ncbi:MAG: general secretion pathway protein GspB [Xanthomonadales bacterium]|nr:general secretion pathway protein GspB [Xanthomonadales bacterium]